MSIYFSQFYDQAGVSFRISAAVTQLLSMRVTESYGDLNQFDDVYGFEVTLNIRLSARKSIDGVIIKGPVVFRKDRDVDYFFDLPFDVISTAPNLIQTFLFYVCEGLKQLFVKYGIDVEGLPQLFERMSSEILSDPKYQKRSPTIDLDLESIRASVLKKPR